MQFASWPDEEFLVAEIWAGEAFVGEVRRNTDKRLIVGLRPTGGSVQGLSLDDLAGALATIQKRLEAG